MSVTNGTSRNGSMVPSTTDSVPERQWSRGWVQTTAGVLWICALHALPYVPLVFGLEAWYDFLATVLAGGTCGVVFWVSLPFLFTYGYSFGYLVAVVLQKRLVVGQFRAGPMTESLRTWMHERAMRSEAWQHVCEPFNNTELLTMIYRALGAKMGKRVQMDFVKVCESDLLTVGDYAVFGSSVSIHCSDADGFRPVSIGKGANVLDHTLLCAGAVVSDTAVLGTETYGRPNKYFPPDSVSMGCKEGDALLLKTNVAASLPARDRNDITTAMSRVHSAKCWYAWNAALLSVAFIIHPLPELAYCLAYGMLASAAETPLDYLVYLPLIALALQFAEILLVVVLKWTMVGKYRAGAFPFFSGYHFKWMVMLGCQHALKTDWLQGTFLLPALYRVMGAKVGKNVCTFGLATEYDLLDIGDRVAVGRGSDNTCHTVENMVIKLATVRLADDATLLEEGIVMPGAAVEKGGLLLEKSQVLKGETLPLGQVWEGLPAERREQGSGLLTSFLA